MEIQCQNPSGCAHKFSWSPPPPTDGIRGVAKITDEPQTNVNHAGIIYKITCPKCECITRIKLKEKKKNG